jgi:mannose-6-phosphate isomerase-like protein (cupin superfamily)
MNRVVTGYDENGNPAIIASGEPPTVIHAGRYTTTELWVSGTGPITATGQDASTRVWALEPPPGGACFRIVELAPGEDTDDSASDDSASDDSASDDSASDDSGLEAAHAGFQDAHATETLDYVTILRGEVTLVIGDSAVTLGPGDSVVQQPGVPHDWQNRSDQPAVMVGVLVSAR